MAYLKRKRIHGQTYWYIAESRRVGGKVKTVTLAYLGKADDILAERDGRDERADRLKSYSHGGVAVLLSLADGLGIAPLIDRHCTPGPRSWPARRILSVGQTLVMAAVGRALHPTSKRAWAAWARKTTVGHLWKFHPAKITSQYFWDQMDRLPVKALDSLWAELGRRIMERFGVSAESLFYDTTNFYTFIDSRNDHCDLPQRGHNKQKRNDLRQFQVGMLVSRDGWVPLLAKLFQGNHNDVTTFPSALAAIRQQCDELGIEPEQVTLVFDKGNLSKKNWRHVDAAKIGYVVSLAPCEYREWAYRPLEEFEACNFPEGKDLQCLRTRTTIGGEERTLVVVDSPTLRDGQLRGLDQQLKPVLFAFSHLEQSLRHATRRRRREKIEQQIARVLNRPTFRDLIRYELTQQSNKPGYWRFEWWIDMGAYHHLRNNIYGRRLIASNRHEWPTEDLIQAYWGQAEAELVFRAMKDPDTLALRPQHHWTDQKIQVHAFCCFVAYLLAALLRREARTMGYTEELTALLQRLSDIRTVLRTESRARAGRPRIRWQLEESDPDSLRLYQSLILPDYLLGPTPSVS